MSKIFKNDLVYEQGYCFFCVNIAPNALYMARRISSASSSPQPSPSHVATNSTLFRATFCCIFFLPEEERCDGEGGNDAGKIGNETASNGVTCILDVDGSEINGEDIERSVRCALQDTAETSNE